MTPSRPGAPASALVITLACIAILSGLVMAYLGHSLLEMQVSTASAGGASASLFARGAVDAVVGELKQEISAGSAAYAPAGSDLRDPGTAFLPVANLAVVPCRMDPSAPPNVIKRSAANVPFYSGAFYSAAWPAPSWAVASSTTNPGTAGRAISLARWNAPLLMPTLDATSTNLTATNTFAPPDWVYMTRAAGPATAWSASLVPDQSGGAVNTNCVVGRFAYVVYDEGGLLDANAAGYPSSVSAAMVRDKISEACADLTKIGLKGSDIDALVSWRNPVGGASAAAYTNAVYTAATNAFLTPASGERLFTSRQQLISFLTQNVANGDPAAVERMQQALPLLTHFSRELNAPTWFPATNAAATGPFAYLLNATNAAATATNLFAPLARAATAYTDASNLAVAPKQPLAFARFPLSRLAWLGPTGPVGATAAQIQQSFGLAWDGADYAWKYVGPSGGSTLAAIAPLAAITGREPNFFELLKAAILAGSTGVVPAPEAFHLTGFDSRYLQSADVTASGSITLGKGAPDPHIVQIGLAIIDQASPSALPTRIEFGASTGTAALYGSKPLPYLYRLVHSAYRPTGAAADQSVFRSWLEPVYWNPYQPATTNAAPGALHLRTRPLSGLIGAATMATVGLTNDIYSYAVPDLVDSTAPVPAGSGSRIEIDHANASLLASLANQPILLADLMAKPGVSATSVDSTGASPGNNVLTEAGTTYAGFWLGDIYAPNPMPAELIPTGIPAGTYTNTVSFFYTLKKPYVFQDTQITVEADYGAAYGGSSSFQEVERMTFGTETGLYVTEPDCSVTAGRRPSYFQFDDPRTGRFGIEHSFSPNYKVNGATLDATDVASVTWTSFLSPSQSLTDLVAYLPVNRPGACTVLPSLTGTKIGTPVDLFRFADNGAAAPATSAPGYNALAAYQDADGVQRRGDGWWSTSTVNTLPMRGDTLPGSVGLPYRPVFLGRPFRSVGELGYAFRDMPWRSLDFGTAASADAGLLDFFCAEDGYAGSTNQPVVAGRLDLNTPHPEVLAALLSGAARSQLSPAADVNAADAAAMAGAITNLTVHTPLLNKAELATRVVPIDPTVTAATPSSNIKERREVIARALAEVGQTRTWNLMIDVVAQTGRFPTGAGGFGDFVITAEQRCWAHVALDRYTGQIVAIQLEPVSQ